MEALSELTRLQKAWVITIQRCDMGWGIIILNIRAGEKHLTLSMKKRDRSEVNFYREVNEEMLYTAREEIRSAQWGRTRFLSSSGSGSNVNVPKKTLKEQRLGPEPEYSEREIWALARVLWEGVLGLSQSTLGKSFGPQPEYSKTTKRRGGSLWPVEARVAAPVGTVSGQKK